jgi:DnaJ family protein A protein 3
VVPIPAGIEDGQTLRISVGGDEKGFGHEIFLTVRVEPSGYFRREGSDVHTDADVSLSQAVLGGIIRIQGLYEDLNVRVPSGTSSHSILTLADRGFKRLDASKGFGNHYVHLRVKVPSRLSQDQRQLMLEYAGLERDTPGTIEGLNNSASAQKNKSSSASNERRAPRVEEAEEKESVEKKEGFLSKLKRTIFG